MATRYLECNAMNRLNVLMSAYACEPGKGSEPGVGWNMACTMAAHHNVWVLTRANNRPAIEAALAAQPVPGLQVTYYDLPAWARWWKRGTRGIQLYYYLWQLGLYRTARALHEHVGFDLAHHVTFVRYWTPSLLALLDIPFIWGPVGGGESTPAPFMQDFGWRATLYERLRNATRRLAEHDPLVTYTARHCTLALTTTSDTADRLRQLGVPRVACLGESALQADELRRLQAMPLPPDAPVRFISMGRLLHWKGFHLGLRAFARAQLPDAEYWIIGDGPERNRLETLAASLGLTNRVRFFGQRPRSETLALLAACHALIHPSLHDSGGWVCLEAMAAGRPVVCLDLGGPATQVTADTGFVVPAHTPGQAVADLAVALRQLARTPQKRLHLGKAGQQRVINAFSWSSKADALAHLYEEILDQPVPLSAAPSSIALP